MGTRRIGRNRIESLFEGLARELTLSGTTFVQTPASTAGFSIGKITVTDKTLPITGNKITLVDTNGTTHVFTFNITSNSTSGNVIGIQTARGVSNDAVATQIAAAINSSSATTSGLIDATASSADVYLRQLVKGADGNTTITLTVAGGVTKTNFLGGAGNGAGAVGTGTAPRTYVERIGGDFITTIEVDIKGFSTTTDVDKVIGLSSGGDAYLAELRTARNGNIYKVEVACLEAPVANTNPGNAKDIDVAVDTSILAYDASGTVSGNTTILEAGGNHALGTTKQNLVINSTALQDKLFVYLRAGAAPASVKAYTAGKFVIKLYGRASF